MKLKRYTVREFKSIWDSGRIDIDDRVTCLVGKNEAGKTALLDALYRTNPIIRSHAKLDETYDYPKREVEDYRFAVENGDQEEVVVVECLYELDKSDCEAVSSMFGPKALRENTFTRETFYGDRNSKFILKVDEKAARIFLSENPNISETLSDKLKKATNWADFAALLATTDEKESGEGDDNEEIDEGKEITEEDEEEEVLTIADLINLVAEIQKDGFAHYVYNSMIWPRAPKFLYFDEYYQMEGRANLNALIQRDDSETLAESDYPLLGLISLARLDLRELVKTKNTTELKNKLEGAGNFLTRRIMKYWSQNRHIKMEFDVRDAKPEDPEGMREGINVWGEVYDTVHWAHTPLGTRSRGFVWFFSFLAWYEDVKRKGENLILLLDEPGLSLHGRAQGDLLTYFDAELSDHQLIYTTHSPFMIDPDRFERVRIVQDLSIDKMEPLPRKEDGTKVLKDVFDATSDSLFPLQGALGYEIQQTLFIGPNSLVVEGPADMHYLRAVSAELEREGRTGLSERWIITPVGGAGKVPTFVALLAPQKGMNVATLLDIQNADRPSIEDIYKKKLLKKKQVLTYGDFTNKNEADVEDMFDKKFYVKLVNLEFEKQLSSPIKISDLNPKTPRIVRAIEEFLEKNPLKSGGFSHYRPARRFTEQVEKLWGDVSDGTKDRFEAAFQELNKLLK